MTLGLDPIGHRAIFNFNIPRVEVKLESNNKKSHFIGKVKDDVAKRKDAEDEKNRGKKTS